MPDSKSVVVTLRPPARTSNPTTKVEIAQVWLPSIGPGELEKIARQSIEASHFFPNDADEFADARVGLEPRIPTIEHGELEGDGVEGIPNLMAWTAA